MQKEKGYAQLTDLIHAPHVVVVVGMSNIVGII